MKIILVYKHNADPIHIAELLYHIINPANKTRNFIILRAWKKSISDNTLTENAHYCANRSFGFESKVKAIKRWQSF